MGCSFIIDALDECDKEITEPDGIIDTLSSIPNPNIKLLFLSRKEGYIQHRLDGWPQTEVGGDRTTQEDIRNFASAQVSELLFHVPHLQLTEENLKEFLLRAAGNMFLYIRLVVQNLIENKGSSPQDLQKMLTNSPKSLDEMYEQYFLTLHRKNDDRRIT